MNLPALAARLNEARMANYRDSKEPRLEPKGICFHPACTAPAETRGLCKSHYRARREKAQRARELPPETPGCAAPGCYRLARALGLCEPHYRQQKLGRAFTAVQVRGPRSTS